jgi:hypothetical protein
VGQFEIRDKRREASLKGAEGERVNELVFKRMNPLPLGPEGEGLASNSFTPSEWSVPENVEKTHYETVFTTDHRLRFKRWLREILLLAQPPLLFQEGNTLA